MTGSASGFESAAATASAGAVAVAVAAGFATATGFVAAGPGGGSRKSAWNSFRAVISSADLPRFGGFAEGSPGVATVTRWTFS